MSQNKRNQATGAVLSAAMLSLVVLLSGCGTSVDPQIAAFRSALVVNAEPEGAVTIEDARKRLAGAPDEGSPSEETADEAVAAEEAPTVQSQGVVLIARVGNREITKWWDEQQATLVVSEGFPDSHYNAGPDHDPKECPFCRSRWKNEDSMAFVRFVDTAGKTIPTDARALLNVQAEDFIVVRGTGELDEDSMLHVTANEVYLRPAAAKPH